MIYHDKCYKCPDRIEYIDKEEVKAKKFHKDYQCDWVFPCGARYNPRYLNLYDVEIIPCYECRRSIKTPLLVNVSLKGR